MAVLNRLEPLRRSFSGRRRPLSRNFSEALPKPSQSPRLFPEPEAARAALPSREAVLRFDKVPLTFSSEPMRINPLVSRNFGLVHRELRHYIHARRAISSDRFRAVPSTARRGN